MQNTAEQKAQNYPKPPFDKVKQEPPGQETQVKIKPDYGQASYRGSDKLKGNVAVIWTPLISSTMPAEKFKTFGQDAPMKRPGQPAELEATYILLASDEASYISGARIAVTGGEPIL